MHQAWLASKNTHIYSIKPGFLHCFHFQLNQHSWHLPVSHTSLTYLSQSDPTAHVRSQSFLCCFMYQPLTCTLFLCCFTEWFKQTGRSAPWTAGASYLSSVTPGFPWFLLSVCWVCLFLWFSLVFSVCGRGSSPSAFIFFIVLCSSLCSHLYLGSYK